MDHDTTKCQSMQSHPSLALNPGTTHHGDQSPAARQQHPPNLPQHRDAPLHRAHVVQHSDADDRVHGPRRQREAQRVRGDHTREPRALARCAVRSLRPCRRELRDGAWKRAVDPGCALCGSVSVQQCGYVPLWDLGHGRCCKMRFGGQGTTVNTDAVRSTHSSCRAHLTSHSGTDMSVPTTTRSSRTPKYLPLPHPTSARRELGARDMRNSRTLGHTGTAGEGAKPWTSGSR